MHHRKVTATIAIAALMTLAVVTAGCTSPLTSSSPTPTPVTQTVTTSGNNTTLTSTAGFKMTWPSKYKYDQNGSTSVKAYIYLDPADSITAVTVSTDTLNRGATLDSLSDYYLNQLRNQNNFTTVQATKNVTLGGKPARTLTWQVPVRIASNQTAVGNTTLQSQTTWTMNNDTSYVVAYKAVSSNFTKSLPEAQKIINSFQLT